MFPCRPFLLFQGELMRRTTLSLAAIVALTLSACGSAGYRGGGGGAAESAPTFRANEQSPANAPNTQQRGVAPSDVSLEKASAAQAPAETQVTIDRKIIRNAELSIESQNPEDSFRKVASLAESKGGFVVFMAR